MDSVESFSRAWYEQFPQETAPDLEVFRKASPRKQDGCSLTDVESAICQREEYVKRLTDELAKEKFVLEYLKGVLKERQSTINGEKENHLNVPDDGSARPKLIRGRPLVQNVEHWRSKSNDSERSDEDDKYSKSPEGYRKNKEKIFKPKHAPSASFTNRSNNAVSIPSRSASMNAAKSPEVSKRHAPVQQTNSDHPLVPPKPRRTKKMDQLLESMGEASANGKTTSDSPSPPPPRSRSHSREKLDAPQASPKVSPKSSPKSTADRQGSKIGRDHPLLAQQGERRGSQGLDDIPRAKDLPSSLKRGSRGPCSTFKKGSNEDLDNRSSPKPLSERRGSQENLLAVKPDHLPVNSRVGKSPSDSAGMYQELAAIFDKKEGLKKPDEARPSSFTNKSYVEIDIDENKRTLERLDKDKKDPSRGIKVPMRPWQRQHNYEEVEIFRKENNSPGIQLPGKSSQASRVAYDYEDIDEVLRQMGKTNPNDGGGTSVSKDEYYDRAELASLSSDDDDGDYDNVLDVTNDLLGDSSSDDDDRIYYNLVRMKPPLIQMSSDATEIEESIYADPRDILERKHEMRKLREEKAVKFRLSTLERKVKRTIHQRLSIDATPAGPGGRSPTQTGHFSIGSDSVFLGVPPEEGVPEHRAASPVPGHSYLDVERPGWTQRSYTSQDERDGEESPSGKSDADTEQLQMRKWVITSILESEKLYLDCLGILRQYMKSLQAAEKTSQPVLPIEDISVIFFRLPEIYDIHEAFYDQLQPLVGKWNADSQVANLFKELVVQQFEVYKEYLLNYKKAVATVQKCSQDNEQFNDLAKSIKGKGIQGSESLEQLLHKPVLRIQRNCLVLEDLVQWTPLSHPDRPVLESALKLSYHNIENLVDPTNDGKVESCDRHLVKNSLIVEQVQGNRKLRHVFLFNDVIVCTKPKMGSKFGFEVKWFIPVPCIKLDDFIHAEEPNTDMIRQWRNSAALWMPTVPFISPTMKDEQEFEKKRKLEVDQLKKRVSVLKYDLKKELQKEDISKDKAFFGGLSGKSVEKIRKKLVEQQAALILASPKLVFRIHYKQNKVYSLLMSSDYERDEWREAIRSVQSKDPKVPNLSVFDVQSLVNSCRQIPRVNVLGTLLMRHAQDEEIMHGMLNVTVKKLMGLVSPVDTFCSLEVDSYGNFSMQAKTNLICNSIEPKWNETFEISLDGSQTLRVLCYKQMSESDCLLGKCALELNQNWLKKEFQEVTLSMGETSILLSVQHVSREQTMKRVQSRMNTGVFGVKLETVLMREGSQFPTIVTACVAAVEKRGLDDVGIYRVSGVSSEIQRLKKLFEKSSKVAVDELVQADIHAVTGLLKLYFRELPEALFTDKLYRRFVDGLGLIDPVSKERCMLTLFKSLPEPNHRCILFIIDHLLRVSKNEDKNKMSVKNLATIFGPTLLRPAFNDVAATPEDLLSMGTRDVFDQSGILLYFLELRLEDHDFSRY
ncbi:active breakpoint cluster region-related protein-like isoform X2 [Lineus longissimus]|uniref:active breakpoint cluster region-related protein-like isoform X2 n=1 Tax=Lineus longissimus TaxID=88925 RepID=UPI00315CF8B0